MYDLSFIKYDVHRHLVAEIYKEAMQDDEVIGLLLQGSVARGDNYKTSDLDMYVLLQDGVQRQFHSTYRRGILVEMKYADFAKAIETCDITAMGVYNFLDAVILFDNEGKLYRVKKQAQALFNQYRTPLAQVQSIAYWLKSSLIKIKAAEAAGDELKAAYVVGTTSWQILEGLWAVNNRPMPPNGSVLFHLTDLERRPAHLEERINRFFVGKGKARVEAAIRMMEWTIDMIDDGAM
jgi:predicted nucleotidyltransferase